MTSSHKPAVLQADEERRLLERIGALARGMGMEWSGPGGVFLLPPAPGQPARWLVYSEWAGTGATADVDVSSGELLCIQDAAVEAVGPPLDLPAALVPGEAEIVAFVQAQAAAAAGWLPEPGLVVHWDAQQHAWEVSSGGVRAGSNGPFMQAVVAGTVGRLRLVSMARLPL